MGVSLRGFCVQQATRSHLRIESNARSGRCTPVTGGPQRRRRRHRAVDSGRKGSQTTPAPVGMTGANARTLPRRRYAVCGRERSGERRRECVGVSRVKTATQRWFTRHWMGFILVTNGSRSVVDRPRHRHPVTRSVPQVVSTPTFVAGLRTTVPPTGGRTREIRRLET